MFTNVAELPKGELYSGNGIPQVAGHSPNKRVYK